MAFVQRTSIHGRRLGISTTGGIISASSGSTAAADQAAQMWGVGLCNEVSSGGELIPNDGITIISSDSTGGEAFIIASPVVGIAKEILCAASASAYTLNTSATSVLFVGTGTGSTQLGNIGSTILTMGSANAVNLFGLSIQLRGLSATRWAVLGRSSSHAVSS